MFSPRYRRQSLVIGLLWFLTLMCSFGLLTWVPSLYVSYFHLPLRRTLQYGALLSLFVFVLPLILRATIDRTGRDLGEVLDATTPSGPVVLAGHSMGGMSILALARQRPELFGDRVVGVFLLAGCVKGITGLGLPAVGIGLLSLVLPPAQAAALVVVPSLATNAWQALDGPALRPLARRLWPMLAMLAFGIILVITPSRSCQKCLLF